MKKIYSTVLSIATVLGAITTAQAQQQPNNGDFESWDSNGEPTNWNNMTTGDLCFLCGFGSSQRVFQDNSEVYSGSASARIESTSAAGTLVNGTMTTGKIVAPDTNPLNGYAFTKRSDALFNHPFTDMPDSLVFYAKYNIIDNSDSASISVVLHDDNDYREPGGNPAQEVAFAKHRFQTGGTANWMRISVPFDYSGSSVNGIAYALMTFTSSYQPGAGNDTAKLWVDDFQFIYNPIDPTSVAQQAAPQVSVYPNPTQNGQIVLSTTAELSNATVTVLNMMGQQLAKSNISNANKIDLQIDGPAGMYLVQVQTDAGYSTVVRVLKN